MKKKDIEKKGFCAVAAPVGVGVMFLLVAFFYNIVHYLFEYIDEVKHAVKK